MAGKFEVFRQTALQTWINVSLIFGLLLWQFSADLLPTTSRSQAKPSATGVKNVEVRPDFLAFYAGGLLTRESPDQLYNEDRQAQAQHAASGLAISTSDQFLPFVYPPATALLFALWTYLPYTTAFYAWAVMNTLLLGIAVFSLAECLGLDEEGRTLLTLLVTASISVYMVLILGQVSILVFSIFVMVVANMRSQKFAQAGLWAGLLALKPTLAPVLFAWFLLRGHWKSFLWASVVASTLGLVSVALVGIKGVQSYFLISQKMATDQFATALPRTMANLRALTAFWNLPVFVWIAAVVLVLGILGFSKRISGFNDWDYAALMIGTMLVAPHLQPQDLILMLIPAALALGQLKSRLTARWRWFLFLLFGFPTAFQMQTGGPRGLNWPLVPLVLIAVFAALIYARDFGPAAAMPFEDEFRSLNANPASKRS